MSYIDEIERSMNKVIWACALFSAICFGTAVGLYQYASAVEAECECME